MKEEKNKYERNLLARAILELDIFYRKAGEVDKPMTISLDDLANMAKLDKKSTEKVLVNFIDEKLICIERSAIIIMDKVKLERE